MDTIRFYDKTKPWYEFSNFYENAPLNIEGKIWPTSEHYYQALKFQHSPDFMEMIRFCDTPGKVYTLANQRKGQYTAKWKINKNVYGDMTIDQAIDISIQSGIKIRSDWDKIKDNAMYYTLKIKFTQNPKMKQLLLLTNNIILIEDSPRDSYWGSGKDGKGQNKLGILLMILRDELQNS